MRRPALIVAGIAVWASLAASAHAATTATLDSHGGSVPWVLRATSKTSNRVPALCLSFLWALGPGERPSEGFPTCTSAAQGHRAGRHIRWIFDTHVSGRYDGVLDPASAGGSPGVMGVTAIVDGRARRVAVRLSDGRTLHLRAHRLPARLHRPMARVVWYVGLSPGYATSLPHVRSVHAYSRHGRLVGHWH